jgi:hypothetical protein
MKLSNRRVLVCKSGNFYRALETLNHIYFVNYEEGDENGSVKMFNRKMQLVSDNYFAYESMFEDVKAGYVWIAPKFEKLYKENFADSE